MYYCHFKFYLQKHSWFISKISKIPSVFFIFITPAVRLTLMQRESSCLEQYLYGCLGSRATNSTGFPWPWHGNACLQSPPSFTAETRLKQCLESYGKPQSSSPYNGRLSLESLQCSSAFPHFDSGGGEIPNVPGNIMDAPPP